MLQQRGQRSPCEEPHLIDEVRGWSFYWEKMFSCPRPVQVLASNISWNIPIYLETGALARALIQKNDPPSHTYVCKQSHAVSRGTYIYIYSPCRPSICFVQLDKRIEKVFNREAARRASSNGRLMQMMGALIILLGLSS